MPARRGLFVATGYLIITLTIGTVLWVAQPLVLTPGMDGTAASVTGKGLALVIGSLLGSWLTFEIVRHHS